MPKSKPKAAQADAEPRDGAAAIGWWKDRFLEAARRGETLVRPAGRIVPLLGEFRAIVEIERRRALTLAARIVVTLLLALVIGAMAGR